jgi:hypothetical protein
MLDLDQFTGFTPGPWVTNTAIHPDDQVFAGKNEIVADCKWTPHIPDVREANAKLIASAPELLELCRIQQAEIKQLLDYRYKHG